MSNNHPMWANTLEVIDKDWKVHYVSPGMDASAQQPQGDGPKSLVALSPLVDVLAKGAAAVAIALYGCGFLVISLHDSEYGFSETNPFRPRILAAGAWFFLFTAIPVIVVARYRGGNQLPWKQFVQYLYPYYVGCYSLAIFSSMFFDFADGPIEASSGARWWVWLIGGLVSLGILVFLQMSKRLPPIVSATTSVLLVVFYVQAVSRELFVAHHFQLGSLALWFFGVGVVTILELNTRSRDQDWTKTVFVLLGALLLFARFYYPHVKASWGGGAPVRVTVCFTRESAVKPGQSVPAQLVDESDAGFYIVGQNETRAIFVPRSAVSLLYFSDELSNSALLRDKK